MRDLRKALFAALCLCTVMSCTPAPRQDFPIEVSTGTPGATSDRSALRLTLSLDRNVYEQKQPIQAVLLLTNLGRDGLLVNARMALNTQSDPGIVRDLYVVIKTPSGEEANMAVKIDMVFLADEYFEILKPGSSLQANCDLYDYYLMDAVGTYSVYGVYENHFNPSDGRSAWKGILQSNTVQFEIR